MAMLSNLCRAVMYANVGAHLLQCPFSVESDPLVALIQCVPRALDFLGFWGNSVNHCVDSHAKAFIRDVFCMSACTILLTSFCWPMIILLIVSQDPSLTLTAMASSRFVAASRANAQFLLLSPLSRSSSHIASWLCQLKLANFVLLD